MHSLVPLVVTGPLHEARKIRLKTVTALVDLTKMRIATRMLVSVTSGVEVLADKLWYLSVKASESNIPGRPLTKNRIGGRGPKGTFWLYAC